MSFGGNIEFEGVVFSDVDEYAAYQGFLDCFRSAPRKQWTIPSCELVYNLAYDLEQVSNLFYETAVHICKGSVKKWNDLVGYGTVEINFNGKIMALYFDYNSLGAESIEEGTQIESRVHLKPDGTANCLSVRKV